MADELGFDSERKKVDVMHKDESVFNDTTISSIRGGPITIGNPKQVTPDKWSTI